MKPLARALDSMLDAAVVPGFSAIGPAIRDRVLDRSPLPRMDERAVLITGATGGLGLETALMVARLGARVTVVGRNRQRVDRAVAAIDEAQDRRGVRAAGIVADLSLIAEVRRVAAMIGDEPLHVLINNVGVLLPERTETGEGLETTLATDLLGHLVLTEQLLDTLRAHAPARIINVSSGGMYTQRIDLDDLQNERHYRGSVAYARAKRGQVILTKIWAEQLAGSGVTVHAMHPGWVDTAGVRSSLPTFRRLTGPLLRTPQQGADTIAWLASVDAETIGSGGFWHDRMRRPTHRSLRTRETAEERARLVDELRALAASVPAASPGGETHPAPR